MNEDKSNEDIAKGRLTQIVESGYHKLVGGILVTNVSSNPVIISK